MAIDGLTMVASRYGYNDTVDRAMAAISALGMTVVARMITPPPRARSAWS
jgi:hypothetical protein